MKLKIILGVGVAVCVMAALGLTLFKSNNSNQGPKTSPKILINTSFYPLYFITKSVAGDLAEIHNITPAGAEPHDYEPTGKDIASINRGQLLIINGLLEPWANKMQDDLLSRGQAVLKISETLPLQSYTDEDGALAKDPHVWLDPVLAQKITDQILAALIQLDPANKNSYLSNASNLKNQLSDLHNEFKTGLANCQQKSFVTSHAAFGYLAKQYGLNQVGISGLSPETEPSPAAVAEVAKFAQKNKIGYIFFESLVSPDIAQTIAQEIGAKTLILNPIEGLTQEEISAGKSYLTEMKNNLANLQIALQCQ